MKGIALVVLAIVPLVYLAPAAEAHPCKGPSCDGQSAMHTGCYKDARTVRVDRSDNRALIELRYSPKCRSAWARVYSNDSEIRALIERADFTTAFATSTTLRSRRSGYQYYGYTKMVNDMNTVARACAEIGELDLCTRTY